MGWGGEQAEEEDEELSRNAGGRIKKVLPFFWVSERGLSSDRGFILTSVQDQPISLSPGFISYFFFNNTLIYHSKFVIVWATALLFQYGDASPASASKQHAYINPVMNPRLI